MHKLHTLTGIAALAALSLTTVTQGATIIATSDGQVRDFAPSDGLGDSASDTSVLAGFQNRSTAGTITPVWAFSMLDAGARAAVTSATFSVDVTGFPGATAFNLDLHVVRVASSADFLASDFETSDSLILEDFWTTTSGSSSNGLGTFSADMTSYLQAPGWTSSDFLILGLKTDSLTLSGTEIKWVSFSTFVEGGPTGATLTVVPEPGTYALLGGLLALGHVMLRRRR